MKTQKQEEGENGEYGKKKNNSKKRRCCDGLAAAQAPFHEGGGWSEQRNISLV